MIILVPLIANSIYFKVFSNAVIRIEKGLYEARTPRWTHFYTLHKIFQVIIFKNQALKSYSLNILHLIKKICVNDEKNNIDNKAWERMNICMLFLAILFSKQLQIQAV